MISLKHILVGEILSDVPARAFTGFMALANAINNAGSTDPEKIRQASS